MSSRALRKLHPQSVDILTDHSEVSSEQTSEYLDDSGYGSVYHSKNKKTVNPFELLNDSNNSSTNDENDNTENKSECTTSDIPPKISKKRKKKKKKKTKCDENLHKSNTANCTGIEDEIDAGIKEVNEMFDVCTRGDVLSENVSSDRADIHLNDTRSVLYVEHKHLKPDNEMRRKFGSKVVQADAARKRQNRRGSPKFWFAHPKDSWPPFGKTGLSMKQLHVQRRSTFFKFEHNHQYQQIQNQFYEAVDSFNPQNIANVLQLHPYHIDSLIQMSEVFRISEDMQMAAELIERALYAFECAFHPSFSLTTGQCRLEYKYPENRAFFLVIFKHLLTVGQRGCYRTALEFCKLLLSLDIDDDPLCVLLMMDFYGLRAEEYVFLIKFFKEWDAHKNLSQLPNFAFSTPLALFHHGILNGGDVSEADSMLQESLLMFPSLLLPLLDKCSVNPDTHVATHSFFASSSHVNDPTALKQLLSLYIGRCFSCWKEPEVLEWLEKNVRVIVSQVEKGDPRVEECRVKRETRYQGTPRNIYRHILLSEIKEARTELPPELATSPVMNYDPLPPADSVTPYVRPVRQRRIDQDGNVLTNLFRSLLPNFNIDEPAPAAAAAGGAEGSNLRQGVGALMEAMRDLLQNIRPVDPPIDNDNGEDNEQPEWD